MKRIYILLIAGISIAACKSNKNVSYAPIPDAEPTYKLDQRVEKYREENGLEIKTNDAALGPGTGGSYSSNASRQEILNNMGKSQAAKPDTTERNLSNSTLELPVLAADTAK